MSNIFISDWKMVPKTEKPGDVDWNLATWDGSRREALRRWAQLPLERVIAALEEMQELSDMLSLTPPNTNGDREE